MNTMLIRGAKMGNVDTRIQFTKSRLYAAMTELLGKKAIGFITIKELCETAGLNRGTFYLHYSAPMDVLREMQEELSGDGMLDFSGGEEQLAEKLRIIIRRRGDYAAVMGRNGDPEFLRGVKIRSFITMLPELKMRCRDKSEKELAIAFDYVFSGCTGAITEWLHAEKPIEPEKMAQMLKKFSEKIYDSI